MNQSGLTLREFYFSHSSLSSFGMDQLGQGVLQPSQAMTFVAANSGNNDFRADWVNNRRSDLMRVCVCQASRITITSSGMVAQ